MWYEGRNPVETAEHIPSMFFLIPSLTIAWALSVVEGLCPWALMGFSEEQLYVSTHVLLLKPWLLQVTWSLCVPSGAWAQFPLPFGTGVGRWLACFGRCKRKGDFFFFFFFPFIPVCFPHPRLLLTMQGEKPEILSIPSP